MWKWILGVLATVVGGVLLQLSTNFLGLNSPPERPQSTGTISDPPPPPTPKPVVMGPLEIGTNRQGNDFDAFGKPTANAQLCAEMCRAETGCDAMTYVKSTGICWMKNGVPAASADADMISSVKVKQAG